MKEKMKSVLDFLINPKRWFSVTCYVALLLFTVAMFLFLALKSSIGVMTFLYSGMGITFFYCCYLFVRYDYKKIKQKCKDLKIYLSGKSKFLNRLFNEIYFRTMLFTSLSLFLGFCFVGYNAFIGFFYHSIWNASISIYYALLVIIKIVFISGEYSLLKNKENINYDADLKRAKMFRLEGALLICVNIVLIAPITLLATSQKDVNLPFWVAIADACYTFYRTTTCVYSFCKTRKNNNLSVKGLKNLNLLSACVSLLTLENTMIITFSDEAGGNMKMLMIISAFVTVGINLWVSISTLIKGNRLVKNNLKNNEKYTI